MLQTSKIIPECLQQNRLNNYCCTHKAINPVDEQNHAHQCTIVAFLVLSASFAKSTSRLKNEC